MNIKFKNGVTLETNNPTEQKVVKSDGSSGWILAFSVYTPMTSVTADGIFTTDNISEISVLDTEGEVEQTITGYEKISSLIIRYSNSAESRADVQLTKDL